MTVNRTWYIRCSCGDLWHGLLLSQWPPDWGESWTLALAFHVEPATFGQRLRCAWDVLRGRRAEYHEIVLDGEGLYALHAACIEAQLLAGPVTTYGTAQSEEATP